MVFINPCREQASHQMREGNDKQPKEEAKSTNQQKLPQWANGIMKSRPQRLSIPSHEGKILSELRTQLLIEVSLAVSLKIGRLESF
jgi:hypothetical protein